VVIFQLEDYTQEDKLDQLRLTFQRDLVTVCK